MDSPDNFDLLICQLFQDGETALMNGCDYKHLEVVSVLLRAGAKTDFQDKV